jgi:hypothetical protein
VELRRVGRVDFFVAIRRAGAITRIGGFVDCIVRICTVEVCVRSNRPSGR